MKQIRLTSVLFGLHEKAHCDLNKIKAYRE